MADNTFQQHRAGESGLPNWAAGSGETVVAIVDQQPPTRAHTLLADRRHVIVFTVPTNATPQEAAERVEGTVAELGITRFDLLGEGTGAAVALWLALAAQAKIGSVVLAAPASLPDQSFRELTRPVLVLVGTEDKSDAGDRCRALLPQCNFMFVYGAERALGTERPEALAFIELEFFERHGLFLVSRESGIGLPQAAQAHRR